MYISIIYLNLGENGCFFILSVIQQKQLNIHVVRIKFISCKNKIRDRTFCLFFLFSIFYELTCFLLFFRSPRDKISIPSIAYRYNTIAHTIGDLYFQLLEFHIHAATEITWIRIWTWTADGITLYSRQAVIANLRNRNSSSLLRSDLIQELPFPWPHQTDSFPRSKPI